MRTNTPRPGRSTQRGFSTLVGNGWLHERPPVPRTPDAPRFWDVKSKSALRKCMFMQVPPELRALAPPPAAPLPAPLRVQAQALPEPYPPRPHNPKRDVRLFPAYHTPAARPAPIQHAQHAPHGRRANDVHIGAPYRAQWWEDPIAVGSMLILMPPIGLAAIWASKRYSNDARWALTVMTALMMCLASVLTIVLMLR